MILRTLLLTLVGTLCSIAFEPLRLEASPWMFNRSNYSHLPPTQPTMVQVDPRVLGGPLYNYPRGDYVQGSYRLSRTQVNVRGRTVDTTYHWEAWVQGGSQY